MTVAQLNKWGVLSVITLVSFMSNVDATIVVIGLPALMEDLGITFETGIWTITAYFISSTIFLLPAGRWSDMLGTKRIFLWGLAVFTAATMLCGLASSGATMIAARFVQGAGAAMTMATGTPILMRTFPPNQFGLALGVNSTSWVVGSLIGPVLGGALIGEFGWRSIFFVVVPFGIVGLIAGFLILKDTNFAGERTKTDWPGIATFGSGLLAFLVALSEGQAWGWVSGPTLALFAAALILGFTFLRIERRVRHPLFHLGLFSNRRYTFGLGLTISYCVGYFSIITLMTLYLQGAQGLSPMEASLLLIPLSAPQLITAPIGGKLADRYGPVRMILLGSFALGIAFLMLGQLGPQLSHWAVIAPLLIVSTATGLSWPSLAKAVLSVVPREQAGAGSGMFWTVFNMSRALSQTLVLAIVQLSSSATVASQLFSVTETAPDAKAQSAMVHATDIGFRFFAAFFLIAIVIGFILQLSAGKTKR
ncbi:MFS transporter [Brevibacillus migulae]|uniref:MFS transporter n=1 Tax=Brevibacillus migulae TaxID=1644114 RepID=UPI00106EF7BB|nr:MFS transporter [Brevibacillus migulae]